MASPQVGSVPAKLSFAKIAAMHAPIPSAPRPNPTEHQKAHAHENGSRRKQPPNPKDERAMSLTKVVRSLQQDRDESDRGPAAITGAIEGLSLVKASASALDGAAGAESGESMEDDGSHLSNSSMKQQSFDAKSMASVTTFAMDEKESIRPDDSASVRAVDDDEPSHGLSRNTTFHSEVEVAMPTLRGGARRETGNVMIAPRRFHTLTLSNPPRFGDLPVSPILESDDISSPSVAPQIIEHHEDRSARNAILPVSPDEKLLDALATPKDRLPILQLEERLLYFISQSRDEFMDLPPQNSFARLLAHKLADYYSLAHHINEDGTSIRIFKTPCASLPTSLATLAKSIPIGSVQPPGAAVKIMRRAGLGQRQFSVGGSTAASSSAPSKATSDAGMETTSDEGLASPMDGTPNRDDSKLTREEREARYKAARERIFGDFQETGTSESASTGENSASMSRSSSSSGKRKSRKHRTPKDDSFEARSAFIPSYTPVPMSSMQPQFSPQYLDQSYHQGYASSPSNFAANINYGTTPTQNYPGFDQAMSYNGTVSYNGGAQQGFMNSENWQSMQPTSPGSYFLHPQTPTGYQQGVSPMMNQSNNPFVHQAPQMHQPNWLNNQFQNPYQQQNNPTATNPNQWAGYGHGAAQHLPNAPSYPYGQLPPSSFANNAPFNPQHPLPGSFSRSLFNPQTRSFVPSNASSRSGGRNGRKKNSPTTSQIRNNHVPKTCASESSTNARGLNIVSSNSSSPKPKEDSLQQKYGAPAHLPKKPPPSQIPSSYDVESISHATPAGSVIVNGVSGAGPGSST